MIAAVEHICAIIKEHNLCNLVVRDMDRRKQNQAEGSYAKCQEVLRRTVKLFPHQPLLVEAWAKGVVATADEGGGKNPGGKRPKMAKHFDWTIEPEGAAQPVPGLPVPSGADPALLEAISGLRAEVAEMREELDGADEQEEKEPEWLKPAVERGFAIADQLIARLFPLAPPAAAIQGLPPAAPLPGVNDDELLRAALRASRNPANAELVKMLLAGYGDAAAAKPPTE